MHNISLEWGDLVIDLSMLDDNNTLDKNEVLPIRLICEKIEIKWEEKNRDWVSGEK